MLRVEQKQLFLLSLPIDARPTSVEFADATATSKAFRIPALLSIAVLGVLLMALWPHRSATSQAELVSNRASATFEHRRINIIILSILLASFLADLISTLWFFHALGIDLEVHPAIKLFGYAFGRSAGPVLGKVLQLVGIMLIGIRFPRFRKLIYILASLLCAGAAWHNVSQLITLSSG